MNQILVTGGAGYIGSHTVLALLSPVKMWWFLIISQIHPPNLWSGLLV